MAEHKDLTAELQRLVTERAKIEADVQKTTGELSSDDGNGLWRTDLLAEKAGHTLFAAILICNQSRGASIIGGKLPALLGVFHGHLRAQQVTEGELEAAEDLWNI